MRRISRVLGAAVLVGAVAVGSASSATTTGPADQSGSAADPPWIPFDAEDFTDPAGTACEFEVKGTVLHDREFFRNVTTYPDGSPRTQQWKGPLGLRLTNTETGKSVDRQAWGNAFINFGLDGDFESIMIQEGHFVGRVRAGTNPGPGLYYVSGEWSSLVRHADGTSSIFVGPRGSAENLCDVLAP